MVNQPEYHAQEEFINRSRKLAELRAMGVEPYPHLFTPSNKCSELILEYNQKEIGHSDDAAAGTTPLAKIAGRLILFRSMGKNAFAHIQDESGKLQLMFNKERTLFCGLSGEEEANSLKLVEKKIDLGDILGVEGHLFHTNKGELTLFVHKVTLLCKTLLPLADKHAGLADKELRYRKRWLDLISHSEIQYTFRLRSQILAYIRAFLTERNFLEVETPVLQSIYGGAEARPFTTKLNALNQEMFLRISLEIPLKKLVVGGMGKVFELGKVFRNEGMDRTHNPEFTMLEAYAPWCDYNDMMELVEQLYEKLALIIFGTTKITTAKEDDGAPLVIELKAPWKRLSMKEAIACYGEKDVDSLTDEQLREELTASGHVDLKKLPTLSRGLLIGAMFEVFAEPHLIQPHHIIDHPIETTPLCKPHRDPAKRKEGLVERFESFILSQEICNAYSELNDPELQRALLEKQAERYEAGDAEATPLDEEFLEAICQGMPPTAGVGIGIDRLVMLFAQADSIRDVLYFPWMKPL